MRVNTEAEQRLNKSLAVGQDELSYSVYKYDYIYTKLAENLNKQVK